MCRSPFSDRHAPASAFPIQFPASSVCRPCLFVLLLLPAALLAEWRAGWVRQKLSAVINFVYLWTRACQRVCLSVCGWNVCGQVGLRPVVLHLTRRLKDLREPLTKKKKVKNRVTQTCRPPLNSGSSYQLHSGAELIEKRSVLTCKWESSGQLCTRWPAPLDPRKWAGWRCKAAGRPFPLWTQIAREVLQKIWAIRWCHWQKDTAKNCEALVVGHLNVFLN